ncbi:MAG: hypothetical protein WBA12_03725 [Catalinimonas sp.]
MYSFFYVLMKVITGDHRAQADRDARRLTEGLALMQQYRHREALIFFSDFLKQEPRCALALVKRGACQLALGEPFLALGDSRRAAEIDHVIMEAYLVAGQALYELDDFLSAKVEFDKAVWYDRKNPEVYRRRGLNYLRMKDHVRATEDLRQAIALGDEDANYYLRRHRLHVKRYNPK